MRHEKHVQIRVFGSGGKCVKFEALVWKMLSCFSIAWAGTTNHKDLDIDAERYQWDNSQSLQIRIVSEGLRDCKSASRKILTLWLDSGKEFSDSTVAKKKAHNFTTASQSSISSKLHHQWIYIRMHFNTRVIQLYILHAQHYILHAQLYILHALHFQNDILNIYGLIPIFEWST